MNCVEVVDLMSDDDEGNDDAGGPRLQKGAMYRIPKRTRSLREPGGDTDVVAIPSAPSASATHIGLVVARTSAKNPQNDVKGVCIAVLCGEQLLRPIMVPGASASAPFWSLDAASGVKPGCTVSFTQKYGGATGFPHEHDDVYATDLRVLSPCASLDGRLTFLTTTDGTQACASRQSTTCALPPARQCLRSWLSLV
jgi:hypothetical protein